MNPPKQTTLDDQLAEFYGRVQLPPTVVSEMLAHGGRSRNGAVRRRVIMTAAAAALLILAAVGVSLLAGGNREVAELAMAEVAKNHRKGIAPEAVSSDYAEVQEHLSRLTFSIQPPASGLVEGFALIGGRYCKVQGEFAAQLKLRPPQGGPAATAFIVPAEGPLAAIDEASSTVIDGVRVRCQRSGNRLVFLAEEAQAD